jgi:hypothetical protein
MPLKVHVAASVATPVEAVGVADYGLQIEKVRSGQQPINLLPNHQMMRPRCLVANERVRRDTEQMVDGGRHVSGIVGMRSRMGRHLVGGAIDDALANSAASQGNRLDPRPVVSLPRR